MGPFVKAHQHSAGALKRVCPPVVVQAQEGVGRSRGGLTSKVVALTDTEGRVVSFTLRPGSAHEGRELEPLLTGGGPARVLADRAYDSSALRFRLAAAGHDPVIPYRTSAKDTSYGYDMDAYKARHLVENAFAYIKQFRGIATRYCKLAVTFCELLSLVCWVVNTRTTRRGRSPHL